MTDVKNKFAAPFAFTKTNANIANSPTAGWKSNARDNSVGLFLDCLVSIDFAAVAAAPANAKGIFLYAYGMVDGANYSGSGAAPIDGTEGLLTFPDYTTLAVSLPIVGFIPYALISTAFISRPMSVRRAFGGILPPKWGLAMVNHSGMTLSINSINGIEQYNTVL